MFIFFYDLNCFIYLWGVIFNSLYSAKYIWASIKLYHHYKLLMQVSELHFENDTRPNRVRFHMKSLIIQSL